MRRQVRCVKWKANTQVRPYDTKKNVIYLYSTNVLCLTAQKTNNEIFLFKNTEQFIKICSVTYICNSSCLDDITVMRKLFYKF
jgi:hypothetical protein